MSNSTELYTNRIANGLKASLIAQVISTGSNAVLILLLTRFFLAPAEFGLLQFALSVLSVVVIFASLGLPKSAARYVTEYVEKDSTQIHFILQRTTLYIIGLCIVVGGILVVAHDPLARLLGEPELRPFLVVGFGYVMFYALSNFLGTIFQGFNRVTYSALVSSISGISRIVFGIGFVLVGLGALGVLLGYVVGFAVATVVGGVLLYKRFYTAFEPTEQPEQGLSKRLLEYSIPLTATKAAGVLDKRVDSILVGVLLNPTAVGFYVLASQIAYVVTVPAGSFGFTISPALGEQKARNQLGTARRLYEEALTYTLLFYVPAAVGLALIAEPLVVLVFGTSYVEAAPVLTVLAAVIVIHSVNQITSDGLDYLGRARSRAIAKAVMAMANFLLNLVLIPTMGVVGAALATVVTYGAYTVVNVYTIHLELSLPVGRLLRKVATVCAISVAMAGVVAVALPYISGLVSLAGVILLGGGIWAALGLASGLVNLRRVASILV